MNKKTTMPAAVQKPFDEVLDLLQKICKEKLNQEYFDLCQTVLLKLARKRPSPLVTSRSKMWAAGIIHAIGTINYLFDKSQTPHMTSGEIVDWFALGQSTISQKSKDIRDLLKMRQFDHNFCLPSKMIDNLMLWLISIDGLMLDAREAPDFIKQIAYENGLIPFIPE